MNDPITLSSSTIARMPRSRFIAQAGMIAALYAAATLICMLLLQGLAWGPVQFRISEAICVVAVLTPAAIPGLTAGCIIANLANMAISGTGALGLLDVVFGSTATLIGAVLCWKLRERPALAIGCFVAALPTRQENGRTVHDFARADIGPIHTSWPPGNLIFRKFPLKWPLPIGNISRFFIRTSF